MRLFKLLSLLLITVMTINVGFAFSPSTNRTEKHTAIFKTADASAMQVYTVAEIKIEFTTPGATLVSINKIGIDANVGFYKVCKHNILKAADLWTFPDITRRSYYIEPRFKPGLKYQKMCLHNILRPPLIL